MEKIFSPFLTMPGADLEINNEIGAEEISTEIAAAKSQFKINWEKQTAAMNTKIEALKNDTEKSEDKELETNF